MEKIASFQVDHTTLMPGLYVSRQDKAGGGMVTTYDIRVVRPNTPPFMTTTEMHTVEHLFATYLRNRYSDIVYFGPMGCRTGFYLLVAGEADLEEIKRRVDACCDFALDYPAGEPVPGQSAIECGNWLDLDLQAAVRIARRLKEIIHKNPPEK